LAELTASTTIILSRKIIVHMLSADFISCRDFQLIEQNAFFLTAVRDAPHCRSRFVRSYECAECE